MTLYQRYLHYVDGGKDNEEAMEIRQAFILQTRSKNESTEAGTDGRDQLL